VTHQPPTLRKVIAAYQRHGHRLWTGEPLDPPDIEMLVRLSTSKEASRAFAALELSEGKGLWVVDDCVEAHRLDTGKHKAHVEGLRRAPDYKKMQAKLESLVEAFGALTEDVREAFGVIRLRFTTAASTTNTTGGRPRARATTRRPAQGPSDGSKSPCAVCRGGTTSNAWRPFATPFSTHATRSVWTR
jgi:hypothetical protein